MDTAHWPHHQDLGLTKPIPMEDGGVVMAPPANPNPSANNTQAIRPAASVERRARPQKEKALNCPRCNSTNTKFCYYNNYSLTQPRYFCKTCRRYWTEGGSLRNVPVGGGSRKNKRPSSSSATAAAAAPTTTHVTAAVVSPSSVISSHARKLMHEAQDLNLAFNHHTVPVPEFTFPSLESSTLRSNNSGAISAMELFRSNNGFVPMSLPPEYAAAGFVLQPDQFRPPQTLAFSLDSGGGGGEVPGNFVGMQDQAGNINGSRLLFPFGDLKPVVSGGGNEFGGNSNKEQGLFWNAMLGGGGGNGATGAGGGGATGDGVSGGNNGASW